MAKKIPDRKNTILNILSIMIFKSGKNGINAAKKYVEAKTKMNCARNRIGNARYDNPIGIP